MSESLEQSVEEIDEELLAILRETCKSYKTFFDALVNWLAELRASDALGDSMRPGVVSYWLIYLLLLSYDIGFISLAILQEGLDRQLLLMKRQVFEFATKAEYLIRFPERAQQQYDAMPLKMKEFVERMGALEAEEAAHDYVKSMIDSAGLPAGTTANYGEVSMFDMLRALEPDAFAQRYAKHYWLPSSIMHGHQIGMLDALRRLKDDKMWLSHRSLLSTKNENVMVITDSMLRLLVLTGDQFKLRGLHWMALVERYNGVVRRLQPGAPVRDLL